MSTDGVRQRWQQERWVAHLAHWHARPLESLTETTPVDLVALHASFHVPTHPAAGSPHSHGVCGGRDCIGTTVPSRRPTHQLDAVPFMCVVCTRLSHPAACIDDDGKAECVCGIADAEREHEYDDVPLGPVDPPDDVGAVIGPMDLSVEEPF